MYLKIARNISFLICIFLISAKSFSQNYVPMDTTKSEKQDLFLKEYKIENELFLKQIKSKYDSKVSKYISGVYSDFSKEFTDEIKKNKFIFESDFLDYANAVLSKIKEVNPELQNQKIKILISREHSLNAFCLADGTFVLHIGLFYWLENEDQFAGVLSHEIAHKILEHGLKNQERTFNFNKESKVKLATLKKEKFNISDKALSLFKETMYENGDKAKKQELEADSLGYVFYKKTKYLPSEYVSGLQLMQKYDSIQPAGVKQDIYKKYFNLPSLPFNEKWLLKEDFTSYDYSQFTEKINLDSIASHPETEIRINKILQAFPETATTTSSTKTNKEAFEKLSKIAYLETVPNLYFDENYGLAIYASLLYLESDTENQTYFKEWLGKSFQKILESRKNYTLNRYLERVSPKDQSESYQQFLSFMWNLKIQEVEEIAKFYTVKY